MSKNMRALAGGLSVIVLIGIMLWIGAAPQRTMLRAPVEPDRLDEATVEAAPSFAPGSELRPAIKHSATRADADRQSGWPASLQGSTPDGEVSLDAEGHLVPTLGLRRLFDYFLSTIGELDLPAIRALLLDHVRGLHGAEVVAEVARLFDRYVDYQRALSESESLLPRELGARLDFAQQLRRRHFDPATAEAFFGEEEAYAEYTLERMRIARDSALSESERNAQLSALEAGLGEDQLASLREARSVEGIEEQSQQFEALDLDPGARFDERSALYGEAAAARLADLDRERAAWDQRVHAYRQARDDIQRNAGFNAQQRAQAIADLRARSFDAQEARRIMSLESIGQI